MPVLEVQQLNKSFGDKQVLTELSFAIDQGEVYGLLGPNGSGKTTTINIICSLLNPDNGAATLQGTAISAASRHKIGVAPQEIALYEDLTCAENLRFFGAIYGLHGRRRAARAQECLDAVGLAASADTRVGKLSGGMRRRVNIAAALLHRPALLILDEPTVALDVEARHQLWELIRALRDQGTTILLTTHYLDEAEQLCSRIGIMRQGKLAAEGTMGQLRALIPAAELAVIEADDRTAVCHRAAEHGFAYRVYGDDLAIWLPRRMTLEEVTTYFHATGLRSIALKPVRLEHVYVELTKADEWGAANAPRAADAASSSGLQAIAAP